MPKVSGWASNKEWNTIWNQQPLILDEPQVSNSTVAPKMQDFLCTMGGTKDAPSITCPWGDAAASGENNPANYLAPMVESAGNAGGQDEKAMSYLGAVYAHLECKTCNPAPDCRLCVVAVTNIGPDGVPLQRTPSAPDDWVSACVLTRTHD